MEAPAFIPNYLGEREDVEATLAGMRKVREIFATEPMASRLRGEIVPGPQVTSDEELIDYMERDGQCSFHQAGSCKMGNDKWSVVDHNLAVRGVDGLRVIDASIMPTVISGNTNGASIMIGEKGADLLRQKS